MTTSESTGLSLRERSTSIGLLPDSRCPKVKSRNDQTGPRKPPTSLLPRYIRSPRGRCHDQGSAKGMLLAAFGRGARAAAVNAKAAADKLGVAGSTVRRWAAGTQKPSAAHQDALQKASRQASTTKAGRKAATADFRSSTRGQKAMVGGPTLWISGNQGPGGNDSDDYTRDRTITFPVDADDVQAMLRAYEEDGDTGLHNWLSEAADDKYLADWGFISIDDFGFGPTR